MPWYGYYDDGVDEEDYDDDYEEIEASADALVISGPVKATSQRGEIGSTWWGQQWVAAMLRLGDARLDRGRRYARNGSVRDLTIQHGLALSHVQGHYARPYQTSVKLKTFAKKDWEQALDALAGQAIYAARLLAGEMPGDIEGVFQSVGLSLFPRSRKDILFDCSCPDWGDPCKHAAAVYYLVAEQLDVDPFILFHLRGYTREKVLDGLRQRRGGSEAIEEIGEAEPGHVPGLDADLSIFWTGSPVNLVRAAPLIPPRPPLLAQLGAPPGGTAIELEGLYTRVSQTALAWLGREEKPSKDLSRAAHPLRADEAIEHLIEKGNQSHIIGKCQESDLRSLNNRTKNFSGLL